MKHYFYQASGNMSRSDQTTLFRCESVFFYEYEFVKGYYIPSESILNEDL